MADKPLHEFVEEVSGESHLRVEHDFGDGFVRLRTSEAERRQAAQDIRCSEDVLIELLRNSKDAHASHIFIASSKDGQNRVLTVVDDGIGIPPAMHEHVFEPRVTSKLDTSHMDAWGLHGRGMALFSISVNTAKAKVCSSDENIGCSIKVVSDTLSLPEKKDQSSFPTFVLTGENEVQVRGPKNLLRTACEFAIEARGACSVYLGSPAEIASALFAYGTSTLSPIDRIFCKDASKVPIVKQLATASDPSELAALCASIGLDLSERTARRIMDGSIVEPQALLDQITLQRPDGQSDGSAKRKASLEGAIIKLQRDDVRLLADSIMPAFDEIADRFYLEPDVEPSITVRSGKLSISIPLVKKP